MTDWYVGQKVVCIDAGLGIAHMLADPNRRYAETMDGLTEGVVYTIREITLWDDEYIGLRLVEIIRPINPDGRESPYADIRFRPLEEQKIKDILSVPADPDSEQWDNRRKAPQRVMEPILYVKTNDGVYTLFGQQSSSESFLDPYRGTWIKSD